MFTLLGDAPEGLFPVVRGHEAVGIVEQLGKGDLGQTGRACHPFFPRRPELPLDQVGQEQPLPDHPQDPRPRRHARWRLAGQRRGQDDPSLQGHLDLQRIHRIARDCRGKDLEGGAAGQGWRRAGI
ncbi:hypothetical protein [Citreicella sp. C3M06]|uniref:hypothetical protein n=1 Tax=Citreicella sp. C3M06 TaxID=2841564 RepID=UPI002090CE5F|nr:hypothetical protein [Citreicella sp. C3M06]